MSNTYLKRISSVSDIMTNESEKFDFLLTKAMDIIINYNYFNGEFAFQDKHPQIFEDLMIADGERNIAGVEHFIHSWLWS